MENAQTKKLGTFLGVYTPTILTIFGVIMYMRAGSLVGTVGLWPMVFIVLISNSITLITTLSFSSIATNKKVGVGGAYYIVSRSLGFEIGGAVGLPLFLSQALSITLYSFGLAEVIKMLFDTSFSLNLVTLGIIAIVAAVSIVGAGFAMKTQIPVMIFVAVSILFLIIGAFMKGSFTECFATFPTSVGEIFAKHGDLSFFSAMAIFFPAVSGIMAGLGLSGDLENPQKSIPVGAITATLTGFAFYVTLPFFLTMGASTEEMLTDQMIWSRISPVNGNIVILPGLLGAIFSSAIASMLGAPRTFIAMACDQVGSRKGQKFLKSKKGEYASFILSLAIACGAVFLGDLNTVASILTIFFLTVYGIVNITAALETISNEPSWRPQFKIPAIISLVGGIACIIVMFLIDPLLSVIAIIIEVILYFILRRVAAKNSAVGDARRGMYENIIKNSLVQLKDLKMTPRNWRPYIQVFINDNEKQIKLVGFASDFGLSSGIVTVTKVIFGRLGEEDLKIEKEIDFMENFYKKYSLSVFPEVTVMENFEEGILAAVQSNGIAGLRSNTIMMCWPDEVGKYLPKYLSVMRRMSTLKKSTVIGKVSPDFDVKNSQKTIHVWWGGLQRNGDLMLLLAYLLTKSPAWDDAVIKLLRMVSDESEKEGAEAELRKLSADSRINAEPMIVIKEKDELFEHVLSRVSSSADVVFLGLNTPAKGEEEDYAKKLEIFAEPLKAVFFIKNSGIFQGQLLETGEEKNR
ncbi:amino acid permease [bacterium]|nr:amino acid permease [bacterium]